MRLLMVYLSNGQEDWSSPYFCPLAEAMQSLHKDTVAYIVSLGEVDPLKDSQCVYIVVDDYNAQVAACENIADDCNPDIIFLHTAKFDGRLARLVQRFPQTVISMDSFSQWDQGTFPGEAIMAFDSCAGVVYSERDRSQYENVLSRNTSCCCLPVNRSTSSAQCLEVAQLLADYFSKCQAHVPVAADSPFISFIVPCYNHAIFLPENIGSLAAQNFADMEVIVVNDGSPDNTSDVVRQCMDKYPQVRYSFAGARK